MHDTGAVRFVEGIGDVATVLQSQVERKRSFAKTIEKRFPFDELHHHEIDTVFTADIVERTDVRVVQARNRASFLLEPLAKLGTLREMRRKHLDGDAAIEAGVFGLVDLPHAAGANGLDNFIRTETGARRKSHGLPVAMVRERRRGIKWSCGLPSRR